MHTRRDFIIGAAGSAALLGGSGAFAESSDLVARAKAEGQFVWYTGLVVNQVVRPLVEKFHAKYGVEARFTTTTDANTVLNITSQARAGRIETDLFDTPGTSIPPLSKAGLIEPFVPDALAKYDAMFKPKSQLYSGIFALYLTTSYNTDLVKTAEAPKTFEDLLAPQWRGKMAWVDTRGISGPPGFIGNIMTTGQDKGMAYLKELSRQRIVREPGNAPPSIR
ncbi:MAG: ABC transporter substrate-binding protein [Acetobacteraceae bacterium]